MQAPPVVKHFDELKDVSPGFLPSVVVPVMDQLIFQRAKEALDDGVPWRRLDTELLDYYCLENEKDLQHMVNRPQ